MDVSIIIAVYNREDFIERCLQSVLAQDFKGGYEIIVVDDGSVDGTKDVLDNFKKYPNLRVVFHDANKGLMCSRNTGIDLSKGGFIAFTDSDCIVERNWLEELLKPFSLDERIAVVGGRILDPPATNYWELVNSGSNFIARQSGYVREIIGCNMAYRRQFLMENRFDTTFKFCAGDDVDLCFRAQQTGKSIYYTQAARVIHYHRSLFKNTLQQQFGYGFMRVYINLKYFKFPFVNIGTIVIAVSVILACIGIYLKSLLFLEFGVTFFSIYLFLILYLCFRSKQGNPLLIIYSFPGQLIASSVNCGGNIYFLVKKFFKMIGV